MDEMADLWMQFLTASGQDRARLSQDFALKWTAEDVAGREGLLVADPGNRTLHNDAGFLYLSLGRAQEALRHFEAVVQLEPASAAARLNLGAVLAQVHRTEDASTQFREALRLYPDFAAAHTSLGNLAVAEGRLDTALEEYLAAVRATPTDPRAQNSMGFIYLNLGQPSMAAPYLYEAVRLDPQMSEAHHNLGLVLYRQGDPAAAIDQYREALKLRSDSPAVMSDLAWLLATMSEDRFRRPEEAVALGEAAALTMGRDAHVLDVLAASYAAAGRFEDALSTIQQALDLDPGLGDPGLRKRQALYRAHQPYREAPPTR